MIRDGWLVSGGERASPYKALPRGSSATVSLVENIRRRGKTRASWKRCVLLFIFSEVWQQLPRDIHASFFMIFRHDSWKISENTVTLTKREATQDSVLNKCDQVDRSIARF